MYSIRGVTDADFGIIPGFFADERELHYAFPNAGWPLTAKDLRRSIEARSDSSVLLAGTTPIGFANLFDIKNNVECTLGNVIIDARRRKKGAGQFLVRGMIGIAIEKYKTPRILVSCWQENNTAMMLYAKLGFTPFGTVTKEFTGGITVPVILLEKIYTCDVEEPSPVGTI